MHGRAAATLDLDHGDGARRRQELRARFQRAAKGDGQRVLADEERFSALGIRIAVNYTLYSMTH